ncbi:protein of unknown function [Burkholderia multivorans]
MIASCISKNISKDIYRKIGCQPGLLGVDCWGAEPDGMEWACGRIDLRQIGLTKEPIQSRTDECGER